MKDAPNTVLMVGIKNCSDKITDLQISEGLES
jgi:hypothetical protein